MREYKDKYIDFLVNLRGVSKDYAKITDYRLTKLVRFLEGEGLKDITEVKRAHLDEYQKLIMRGKYTPHTAGEMLSGVIVFFRYLYDYGHITENPALVIDTPRLEQRIPRDIMNEEEIKYLVSLPNKNDLLGIRDICIMKLLYSSAMRPIEVFNMRLEDIDLKRNQAIVRRPKNRHDRIVHFDKYTAHYLDSYIKKTRRWLLRGRPLDYLFVGIKTDKFTSGAFAQHFKRVYARVVKRGSQSS